MLKQYKLRDYNFRLVLWLIALSTLGVLLVGSAEASLENKQLAGVILGVFIMLILSLIDFSWILNFYWIIYGVNILLLLLVIVAGSSAGGATRWFAIGGFRFQPVELSKILLILFFSKYFMVHENDLNKPKIILRSLALIGLPLILIFRQPDLKNTITIFILFSLLYYAAGLSYKFIFSVLAIVIVLGAVFMTIVIQPNQSLIKDYQRKRIMAFLNPDSPEYTDDTTQQNNSVTAIGSGELTGKGLNNSSVSSANKGNFISQIQTDFIFAVAGEELGFLGSAGIVILLLLIVLECLLMSRRAKDLSGRIVCCGMAAVVSIQSFINIGVATRMLPNTGTPLPFVSYGLTSLVSLFIGMGIVLNVGLQNRIHVPEVRRTSRQKGVRISL
ncbi:MAG TPA: FtsW/RodA/SpoVE family cell cycle protein [Lachnospiraceae bacterium]|nr:FtsW/RodA/SpoVE family cell cycle protein [Lachnospiraceae bacterium]